MRDFLVWSLIFLQIEAFKENGSIQLGIFEVNSFNFAD